MTTRSETSPPDDVAVLFDRFVGAGPIPQLGRGHTRERLSALTEASRPSLSAGRLCEAHADGQSILIDAGLDPRPLGALAVWASERSDVPPVAVHGGSGDRRLVGTKWFCSGATLVDHALVTCTEGSDRNLALIALDGPGVDVCPSEWRSTGMRGADTRRVELVGAPVVAMVGDAGWYLERPGFWHGAIGVAASWFGGIVDVAATVAAGVKHDDGHALADLGAITALVYGLTATLDRAAAEIDADPDDVLAARERALAVRNLVAGGAVTVMELAAQALGPRALTGDADHAQRVADLDVYVRQHHGRRDDEQLGRLRAGGEER